jgi:FkbM family methyltransferase
LKHDTRTITHCFGFADSVENRPFCSNTPSVSNSLLETHSNAHDVWGESVLETKERLILSFQTLDSFLVEKGIQAVDVLKLHVQGAEYLVMKGAEDPLRSRKT